MAFTEFRTWTPGETVTAALLNAQVRDNGNAIKVAIEHIVKGGTLINTDGLTVTTECLAWRAPFACEVVGLLSRRVGGGASVTKVNARKNGTDEHLATDLELTDADTDYETTSVQNGTYAPGDWLEIMITEIAGSPTEVFIGVEFSAL